MNNAIFGIANFDVYAIIGVLVFFSLIETFSGFLFSTRRTISDWIQELGNFFLLSFITKPLVVLASMALCNWALPGFANRFDESALWFTLPLFLLIDDILQYWYHRFGHEYAWLWKLHRPHHQAEEMGFFVSYRNSVWYYFLMPNIFWIGIFTFLGGAKAVAVGLILKQIVIIGSHSTLQWDKLLYRFPILNPVTSLIERVLVTPAFHHAHQGKSMIDGISDPNGNFGNMFSIWDQIFGTAKYTRTFPNDYGLVNDPVEGWLPALFYPVVFSKKPESELSKGYRKERTARMEPATRSFEKGERFLWCRCGTSKNQPFCDGSHHGTKFKPLACEAKRTGSAKLCSCKLTKSPPYCDNSHSKGARGRITLAGESFPAANNQHEHL